MSTCKWSTIHTWVGRRDGSKSRSSTSISRSRAAEDSGISRQPGLGHPCPLCAGALPTLYTHARARARAAEPRPDQGDPRTRSDLALPEVALSEQHRPKRNDVEAPHRLGEGALGHAGHGRVSKAAEEGAPGRGASEPRINRQTSNEASERRFQSSGRLGGGALNPEPSAVRGRGAAEAGVTRMSRFSFSEQRWPAESVASYSNLRAGSGCRV